MIKYLLLCLIFFSLFDEIFACQSCMDSNKIYRREQLERTTQEVPYTNRHEIVVQIDDTSVSSLSQVESLAIELGFRLGGPVGPKNYYIFYRSMEERSDGHELSSHGGIVWWQEQKPKERFTRSIVKRSENVTRSTWTWPRDNELYKQSYLVNPKDVPGGPNYSGDPLNINVLETWQNGIIGTGVIVAVVDDGVEYTHADLYGNWNEFFSYDYNYNDNEPLPHSYDSHGTSVAGIVAATRDTCCGVGVAYGAQFAARRILGAYPTDAIEAGALSYKSMTNNPNGKILHIISCSWGPSDDGVTAEKPGRLAQLSMEESIAEGRNGLGLIYVWAAGNGRSNGDNINWDKYASSRYVIPVGSVDSYKKTTYYSEPGACLMLSTPSSSRYNGVTTTDLTGYSGDSVADCTHRFGGTSASCPMVSGAVALMLQANPNLSWRDVKHILAHTSQPVDIEENRGEWHVNGAQLVHSHTYGFGVLDVTGAVRMASEWTPVGREVTQTSESMHPNLELPFGRNGPTIKRTSWYASETDFPRPTYLEHVELFIRADTPEGVGKLAIQVCSPWATCSTMTGPNPKEKKTLSWTFLSVRHWGEDIINRDPFQNGESNSSTKNSKKTAAPHDPNEWRLNVMNVATSQSEPIVIKEWKLTFYGVYL